jgi:hypothetical protein
VVPVNLDTAMPAGSLGLTEANLALIYDPSIFTVANSDLRLGTLPASGSDWGLTSSINPITGQIGINLFSPTPLATTDGGSLVTIAFHVLPTAPAGTTSIALAAEVNPSGSRLVRTGLADPQSGLTLHTAPTNGAADAGMDEIVTLSGAGLTTTPGSRAADLVNPVRFLVNTEVPSDGSFVVSAMGNSGVPETTPLDQFFQGLAAGPLSAGALLSSPAKFDAALASLLETPTAAVPLPATPEALRLDASSEVPDWLPDLARALLGRAADSRQPEWTADDQAGAVRDDSDSADLFRWEDYAALVAAAHGSGELPSEPPG